MHRTQRWRAAHWAVALIVGCTAAARAQNPPDPPVIPSPAALKVPAEPPPPAVEPVRPENGTVATPLAPQGGVAALFNPTLGHVPIRADYRITWFADEHVAGQSTHLGYWQNDVGVSFPL